MHKTLAFLLFFAIGITVVSTAASIAPATAASTTAYRPDQILIQPRVGADPQALAAFQTAHGAKILRRFSHSGGSQVVAVPAGETVAGLVAEYQRSGLVAFAEPDFYVHADATIPNDPFFADGYLWALDNYGQSSYGGHPGTPHADIDAIDAWSVLTSASNIIVAVLDTGIRATHQDLAANMWANPQDGTHGFNAFDGLNDPSDDSGHGTMVAGILGAVGNNGVGITGVAWRVQMMACKCLDSNGNGSDSSVIPCIEFAVAHGAQVINASFDTTTPSLALSNALVGAQAAGVIVVASAGNVPADVDVTPHYPACYPLDNIVSVAYTTRNDTLGSLSNYGATNVMLAAPGDSIFSTFAASDSYYYPPPLSGVNLAGTSFAAGYVSGTVALMLAKYPGESYQLIIQRLKQATDPLPTLAGKCLTGGRLNLRKALNPNIYLASAGAGHPATQWQLSTGPNRQCVVQSSTNLGTWTSVYTNTTSTNGTFTFTNTLAAPQLFFRGAAIP